MATAPKNSPSEETRSLIECPVCVSTFRNPKSLRCGHSVCFECCQQLRTGMLVACPVCRTRTSIPAEGLPTNFALQDLIEHHVSQQQVEKKHVCNACGRRHVIDESWICSLCNSTLICANCAIKDHRGHDLQMVSDIISRRREELAEWRQRMEVNIREIDARRRQIDTNVIRIEQRSTQLDATLRTRLEPRFAETIQALNAERDQVFKAIHEIDVSDIVGTSSNEDTATANGASQFENQLNEVPQKLELLKAKQEQILADQRLALEVVQNCNEVLRQILSRGLKVTSDETQNQNQADAIADGAASTLTDRSGSRLCGHSQAENCTQRNRFFPSPNRRGVISTRGTRLLSGYGRGRPLQDYGFTPPGTGTAAGDDDGSIEEVFRRFNITDDVHTEQDEAVETASEVVAEPPATTAEEWQFMPNLRFMPRSRPAHNFFGPVPTAGRRGLRNTSSVGAGRGTIFFDLTSDDEQDIAVPGIGRGRISGRGAGANANSSLRLNRGRGRMPEASSHRAASSRFRDDMSLLAEATARGPSDSSTSRMIRRNNSQHREHRVSNRQRNNENESGPSTSVATGTVDGPVRIPSDSSDDDVSDGIMFHTFLESGGRANDKTKH